MYTSIAKCLVFIVVTKVDSVGYINYYYSNSGQQSKPKGDGGKNVRFANMRGAFFLVLGILSLSLTKQCNSVVHVYQTHSHGHHDGRYRTAQRCGHCYTADNGDKDAEYQRAVGIHLTASVILACTVTICSAEEKFLA